MNFRSSVASLNEGEEQSIYLQGSSVNIDFSSLYDI